ncbi:zinc-binding dehydrogenase [Herbidospora sp. NEAU-GS84]|uniref:Zinc-binding dehydrogenase n=1 Tax=Herbidospora solisilvae TaxID=2696284 RepID=A0A7C9JHS4_9ACTN|nr:zinc-binding dehydrogenase [Herbidospora solisilvae]NAS26921.1 zinc-binding dehydrogenase [Herbidospora solisilvae]
MTTHAVMVTRFGGPDVLELVETPDPAPGDGQTLVEVEASDTLLLETVVRSGLGRDFWPIRPPYVPGGGVAGWDPDGRRVAGYTNGYGGYASKAVATSVVEVPGGVSLQAAAALLHDATTALALFEAARIGPSDTVLVVGASGGLGVLEIQLARARGAKVIAVARAAKLARVEEFGADVLVDAADPEWPRADVVLDNVGGALGARAVPLVNPGGRFSAHGAAGGAFTTVDRPDVAATGIEVAQLSADDRVRHLTEALRLTAEGTLRPAVGQTFPLAEAASAHAAMEARLVFGKTLLTGTLGG